MVQDFIEILYLGEEGQTIFATDSLREWDDSQIKLLKRQIPQQQESFNAKGIASVELHCIRKIGALPALCIEELNKHLYTLSDSERNKIRPNLSNWPSPIPIDLD